MNSPRTAHNVKQAVGRVVLGIWAPSITLVVTSLMVGHWVPLPTPAIDGAELPLKLAELRAELGDESEWTAYHVLYADCRCSRRVFDHLIEEQRDPRVRDIILLVGTDDAFAAACREKAIELRSVTPDELEERFKVVSAPMLITCAPDGHICYLGGYTSRQQGPQIEDLRIFNALIAGEEVAALPVYGCGVAPSLKGVLDPLGLKY